MTKLQNAALCALADLIGLYWETALDTPAKKTVVELYSALKDEGVDVGCYSKDVEYVTEYISDEEE